MTFKKLLTAVEIYLIYDNKYQEQSNIFKPERKGIELNKGIIECALVIRHWMVIINSNQGVKNKNFKTGRSGRTNNSYYYDSIISMQIFNMRWMRELLGKQCFKIGIHKIEA